MDQSKIADPEAVKPEDWDEDAPATILDMDAVKVGLAAPHRGPISRSRDLVCVWSRTD